MITQKTINWLMIAFFAVLVAIVFQQIHTSMTEQGIASGGPYDNAAAYPRAVAIVVAVLAIVQALIDGLSSAPQSSKDGAVRLASLKRPALLLVIFGIYLALLNTLGYHLTTAPMIFAIMWLCGARKVWKLALASIVIAFVAAYIFENYLNIVLPGGILRLNIPW